MSTDDARRRGDLVDRYLATVGVAAAEPSVALADALVRAHVDALPFSSLSVRLGEDLPLHLESVHERLVTRRRGGYCFEHNLLMYEVLTELGFATRMYLGRVLLSGNPHPGLTHRVTVVRVDGADYLVDVGFGPQGATAAVPFDGTAVGRPWRQVRLVERAEGGYLAQYGVDGQFADMYRFELAQYGASDCEVGHFYSHRHPQSHFVTTLVASRLLADETRSLRNLDYWVLRPGGTTRSVVDSAGELERILVDEPGFDATGPECEQLFSAVAAQ